MTKKWSSTASMDGKTKRQASKDDRAEAKEALFTMFEEIDAGLADLKARLPRIPKSQRRR